MQARYGFLERFALLRANFAQKKGNCVRVKHGFHEAGNLTRVGLKMFYFICLTGRAVYLPRLMAPWPRASCGSHPSHHVCWTIQQVPALGEMIVEGQRLSEIEASAECSILVGRAERELPPLLSLKTRAYSRSNVPHATPLASSKSFPWNIITRIIL